MTAERTPSRDKIIRGFVDQAIRGAWTMLPGKVEAYDPDQQLADIKPTLKDSLPGDPVEDLPIIRNVPVQWFRVGLAVIYLPMTVGSLGSIIFCSRSLDKWESTNGQDPIDPQDTRHHALSDGVFMPGLYPFGDPIPNVDPVDIRIVLLDENGNTRSELYLGGDTGDIVAIAENRVQLGSANPIKEAARKEDSTISTAVEEATYWAWLLGFVAVITSWTVNPGDGGAALKAAMTAYIGTNPVPTQMVGKITSGSSKVFIED